MHNMACIVNDRENYEEAVSLLEEIVWIQKRVQEEKHPELPC